MASFWDIANTTDFDTFFKGNYTFLVQQISLSAKLSLGYIHFKILQDFLLSSFNIPNCISRLSLPSLCEPRYNREDGLLIFGLKSYAGLFNGYSPNLIRINMFQNQYILWQALYILIIDGHPRREVLDFIENCCLLYAPRRFRRNVNSFIVSFIALGWFIDLLKLLFLCVTLCNFM